MLQHLKRTTCNSMVWILFIFAIMSSEKVKMVDGSTAAAQLVTKLNQTCFQDANKYNSDLINKTKCPVNYNYICWSQTEAGGNATEICPSFLYYPNKNVTRRCSVNGTWEAVSLATECNALPLNISNAKFLNLLAAYNISYSYATLAPPKATAKPSVLFQLMAKLLQSCKNDVTKYRPALVNKTKCPVSYNFICWPQTQAGTNITMQCPGMFYYSNSYVNRRCFANGTWEPIVLSKMCTPLPLSILDANFLKLLALYNISYPTPVTITKNPHTVRQVQIFVIMEWISFSIMVPSLILLLTFPNFNDDRMNLHRCLVLAFLLSVVTFLPEYYLSLSIKNPRACNALWILNRLFAVSEVGWMFSEGLYLLKTIVFVFSQKSYMWLFALIGWGIPIVLTLFAWTPVMASKIGNISTRCWTLDAQNHLMLIIYLPMTIMLAINMLILFYVIGVVISKLRQNHSADFQSSRKAAKGAIVLMPLLGAVYLMIFYAPSNVIWYNYFLVIAQPMQGILVCLVHVFLNKDIHSAVKNKWRKMTQNTTLFQSTFFSAAGPPVSRNRSSQATHSPSKPSKRPSLKLKKQMSSKVAPMGSPKTGDAKTNNNNNNNPDRQVQFAVQEAPNDVTNNDRIQSFKQPELTGH